MSTRICFCSVPLSNPYIFVSTNADNDETIRNDIESTQTILEVVIDSTYHTKEIDLICVFRNRNGNENGTIQPNR